MKKFKEIKVGFWNKLTYIKWCVKQIVELNRLISKNANDINSFYKCFDEFSDRIYEQRLSLLEFKQTAKRLEERIEKLEPKLTTPAHETSHMAAVRLLDNMDDRMRAYWEVFGKAYISVLFGGWLTIEEVYQKGLKYSYGDFYSSKGNFRKSLLALEKKKWCVIKGDRFILVIPEKHDKYSHGQGGKF